MTLLQKILAPILIAIPLTTMASDLAENKIKVFEALKKNGIVVAATYQSTSGKENNFSTLLTNAGIVNVNYQTGSIFIDNDLIKVDDQGNFESSNARVINQYLDDLEYKIIAKAKNEKYRIQVFVDITCEFCKIFDKTVPSLNQAGITVEFILTSKNGDQAPQYLQMSAIQSEPNQLQALTNQMNGIVPSYIPKQPSLQMALHQQAAVVVGLKATPTIYYKGLKLPAVSANKYPELIKSVEDSVKMKTDTYTVNRID